MIEVSETVGKTHHYRKECPPQHDKLCKEDISKVLVEDRAVERIEDEVRQQITNVLKEISLNC